ncbi:MAG TPA: D-glycerate dehydrogenase [Thermoanaerobaculia bacterium]|nr:D-glycerate dehydrogenase [Thermoanaerobaculia bacterium]
MRHTVVLTAAFPRIARDMLAATFDVVEHPTEHERSEDEMITMLSDADGAITLLSDPLTRRVLSANPNLRIVANFAVGYNNVDIAAARELGIVVTNTPGVLTEATADLTMALILAVTRRVVEGDREIRATGRCEWEPLKLLGSSLSAKTLGIIGMGRVGTAVARRAVAFGMDVIHTGRANGTPLGELLAKSDIVSLHAPLTHATRHIIDGRALAAMKAGSYLINTSRGALVDEDALCDALDSGHLRGAALDVYEHEPVVNPRLLAMPNVVVVPHIGSATEEARNAMATLAATDIMRFFSGQPPLNAVA